MEVLGEVVQGRPMTIYSFLGEWHFRAPKKNMAPIINRLHWGDKKKPTVIRGYFTPFVQLVTEPTLYNNHDLDWSRGWVSLTKSPQKHLPGSTILLGGISKTRIMLAFFARGGFFWLFCAGWTSCCVLGLQHLSLGFGKHGWLAGNWTLNQDEFAIEKWPNVGWPEWSMPGHWDQ